ncbi:MAG TPA: hypothetical protein VFP44_02700 [Usitatibacter sp.]|nr:hypothetical protein [Usitatibacter sp.]
MQRFDPAPAAALLAQAWRGGTAFVGDGVGFAALAFTLQRR